MAIIPQAKLPSIPLPSIRNIPNIPGVGCAGGDGTSYLGEQFGNVPDVLAATHIRGLIKTCEDQIFALIKGELPDIPRAIAYAQKAAELAEYVTSLLSTLNESIGSIVGEAQASINFVNQKIQEVNSAKSQILAVPEAGRTAVQRLALSRYNEYAQELNAQIGRLQSTIGCISG